MNTNFNFNKELIKKEIVKMLNLKKKNSDIIIHPSITTYKSINRKQREVYSFNGK